jgi:hypothetical protein
MTGMNASNPPALVVEGGTVKVADRNGTRDLPIPADLVLPPPPAPSDDPRKQFSVLELGHGALVTLA